MYSELSTVAQSGTELSNEHERDENDKIIQPSVDLSCSAFATEEEYDAYVDAISPPRELVCPITQEVFRDPVVAEDGHTYERSAILRWFSLGRMRSPVTNSFMGGHSVYPNLAVQGMALAYRERLGKELLRRSQWVYHHGGQCPDNGLRISALLDAGADASLRDSESGGDNTTSLLLMIKSTNLNLARTVLQHDATVSTSGDGGMECINAAQATMEKALTSSRTNNAASDLRMEWTEFIEEIRQKAMREEAAKKEKERARNQANQEHRDRQRTLATEARARADARRFGGVTATGGVTAVRGIGDLEDGLGYFPSLVALQFQGSIPPPSASVAVTEGREKERLRRIMKFIGFAVAVYFVLS